MLVDEWPNDRCVRVEIGRTLNLKLSINETAHSMSLVCVSLKLESLPAFVVSTC